MQPRPSGTRQLPPGPGFESVMPNRADAVTLPDGDEQEIVIRWGDPILEGAPDFDPGTHTPAAQAGQFGYTCGHLALLHQPWNAGQRVLVASHHDTDEERMFPGYDAAAPTRDQVATTWAAHGLSIVVLDQDLHTHSLTPVVGHALNRRITATTPFAVTGPAAGSDLLTTSADPEGTVVLGTFNNCGGGITPWNTVLSGEQHCHQYFANADRVTDPTVRARLTRYGPARGASARRWEQFDPRFDLAHEPNETNRHGWIVEIDPFGPTATPRKLTALGRFDHEAAEPLLTGEGRVAVYMGDRERFAYLYKYVSDKTVKFGLGRRVEAHNRSLLDQGTLYVAAFTAGNPAKQVDGTGTWVPLARGNKSFVDGMSAAEVYVFTRLAADKVGATKIDRPQDVEPNPKSGKVYLARAGCTRHGATGRSGTGDAFPCNGNRCGQVLELTETTGQAAAPTFGWSLLLACGNPEDRSTHVGGLGKNQAAPIDPPDHLAFDPRGNLWIATGDNAPGANDGLCRIALEGPNRGQVEQSLTVPIGTASCGPIIEEHRLLIAARLPGALDDTDPLLRPAVVDVTRHDHGRIGR